MTGISKFIAKVPEADFIFDEPKRTSENMEAVATSAPHRSQ